MRIFIVEDHPALLQTLCAYFESQPDFTVCGSAVSVAQALEGIDTGEPDVVCTDLNLPDTDGIQLTSEILKKHPTVRIVILSWHMKAIYARRAREAGASGYLVKGQPEEICDAIRKVAGGGVHFPENLP